MPKHSPGYQFRTTIDFGDRFTAKKTKSAGSAADGSHALVPCDGREIVRAMASDYMGTDYDLLRKNCCTFAHDACIQLGVEETEIPTWFHNLAAAGAVTQDAASSTLGPLTNVFTVCELDKFAQYLTDETAFDDGFEVIKGSPDESEQIVDGTCR
jgi:PPPDE putative peptidase domain